MSTLEGWGTFCAVTGDAAGPLTAITFAVVTFARRDAAGAVDWVTEFGTSTIVHFSTALFVSAILSAPWPAVWPVASLLGLLGLAGFAYGVVVARRLQRGTDYRPDWEDRLCYAALPLVAYALLVAAAVLLAVAGSPGAFGGAAAMLLLLAVGIHNSWDTVTYLAAGRGQSGELSGPKP